MSVDHQVDTDRIELILGSDLSLELFHRISHELSVQVEPDGGDVTGLGFRQDASSTSDLEITHREFEARTKVCELADGFESAIRRLTYAFLGRMEQVGIRPLGRASNPPPQLVQLAEAEAISALHDQCVHLGQVKAGLDDRGGHQHVVFTVPEVIHDLFELTLTHLAVSDRDLGIGHEFPESHYCVVDRLHPIVHVIHLTFAQHLSANRGRDSLLIERPHISEDRVSVLWRCSDVRHISYPRQGHLESPGYRCCRECENVHACAEFTKCILCLDPESLLLVDDDKAEVRELEVAREQPVGSHDDVDRAVSYPLHYLVLLSCCQEPGQHLDLDGVRRKPIRKVHIVLLCQKCGRHEHHDLLPILDRFEHRT